MLKYLVAVCLVSSAALAQQQQPSSPYEQALTAKLNYEIDGGLRCNTALITINAGATQAQAKVADLQKQLDTAVAHAADLQKQLDAKADPGQ